MLTMQPWCLRSCGAAACERNSGAVEVGADQVVPVLFADFADRRGVEAGSVVEQHVEPAETRHGVGDDTAVAGGVEQVALDQRGGIRALQVEFGGQGLRLAFRGTVVDHDSGAFPVQAAADGRTDPFGPACDENDFALHDNLH